MGKSIIISAPSGAGKTTIVHHLLDQDSLQLVFSISVTSRYKRPKEEHGKDYYFIGIDGFKEKIRKDELLEWQEVYPSQFYGTLWSEVDRIWKSGKHVAFDVDTEGGINLKKILGKDALALFIMPPSVDELEKRLRARGTESEEKLKTRIGKAKEEMKRAKCFDIIVINDNLPHALQETEMLVRDFLSS